MASSRKDAEPTTPRRPPATTRQARENQLISLAVDLAERQLRDGTATSQVTIHYLKLATTREAVEQEKLVLEKELLKARTESIASGKRVEELYSNALNAMRSYAGQETEEEALD